MAMNVIFSSKKGLRDELKVGDESHLVKEMEELLKKKQPEDML